MNRLTAVTFILLSLIRPAVASAQAFAVPISDRVIEGDLALPDGGVAHFIVREGAMLTVRDDESGYWYGFVPVIAEGEKEVRLTPFEISEQDDVGHRVSQLIGLDSRVEIGSMSEFSTNDVDLKISFQSIERWIFPKLKLMDPHSSRPSDLQKIFGASGGGMCCVTCGVITVCGGAVSMSCGSCDGGGGRPAV